jgi:hypothetical protein
VTAIPKVVFSRTLDSVQGNARLAEASVAEEAAAALDATGKDVSIGGAGLAAAAIELGLVDELRMFCSASRWPRHPPRWTHSHCPRDDPRLPPDRTPQARQTARPAAGFRPGSRPVRAG